MDDFPLFCLIRSKHNSAFPVFGFVAAMGEPSRASSSSRKRSREIETLSLEIRKYPRDLLHGFPPADPNSSHRRGRSETEGELEDGDLELSLGLSLGGRFGVDRSHGGLARASSIAGTMPLMREANSKAPPAAAALARAASLPTETEEEWRRRKELQTLRRLEAKRRISEKQKIGKENSASEEKESALNLNLKQQVAPIGLKAKGGGFIGSLQGLLAQQQQQGCSQGSAESQGGSSSGASEFESRSLQGSGSFGEARSPANTHPTQERGNQESSMGSSSHTKHVENPSTNPSNSACKKTETSSNRLEDMPCVFTIGDGPNGRKVEGILYRYAKGEEVRIMCICHGGFFSPAEFVKHAGARDVEHPLRRIVVNPSASPFS